MLYASYICTQYIYQISTSQYISNQLHTSYIPAIYQLSTSYMHRTTYQLSCISATSYIRMPSNLPTHMFKLPKWLHGFGWDTQIWLECQCQLQEIYDMKTCRFWVIFKSFGIQLEYGWNIPTIFQMTPTQLEYSWNIPTIYQLYSK